MLKILKYSFFDVLRSRWSIIYFMFFLLITTGLLWFSGNVAKSIISLMNVVLAIIPLMSILFGTMYFYNSREFVEILLSQPIDRKRIFLGQFLGLSLSLILSFSLGMGIPFLIYGVAVSAEIFDFLVLLLTGNLLSLVFTALAFLISISNQNKIKGFALSILIWLFLAVVYDSIYLVIMAFFNDYPLETPTLLITLFNPIDLSRILILMKLDISALMGFTGALFKTFLGSGTGSLLSITALVIWIGLPVYAFLKLAIKKDF